MTACPTTSAPPAAPRPRRVWPILAVLTAATLWTVTGEMAPAGLLPAMSADLGVPLSAVGVLVSAWAITIAVAGIPLVRLTVAVPRARVLSVSLVVIAAANLLTAAAPGLGLAVTGRILAAAAHGLFWALVVSYTATLVEPARLGRALAIVLAGPTVAGLVGLPAATYLAGLIGWRAVLAGLSGILLLTALAVRMLLPATDGPAPAPGGFGDRSALRVLAVAAGGGVVLVGHFAAFTYVAALITRLGGVSSGAVPLALLVFGFAGAAGVAVSGIASDRFPHSATPAAALLLTGGLALLAFGADRPVALFAGLAVWGLAIGGFPPVLQARVLRLSSLAFRPLAGSVVITVLNLGIAGGATLGGLVLGHGAHALLLMATTAAAVGTLTLALLPGDGPRSRRVAVTRPRR